MDILSEKKQCKKLNSSSMSISSCDSREETNFKRSIECDGNSSLQYEHDTHYYEESKRSMDDQYKPRALGKSQVSVVVLDEDYETTEMVKNLETEVYSSGEIMLQDIIDSLKRKGFYLKKKMIFIMDFTSSSYLFVGVEGSLRETFIKCQERIVQIKIRSSYQETNVKEKPKSIKDIITKVAEWRRWYNGRRGISGNYERKELDQSALDLGIPKKTLDDYMFQLRKARAGGFDFERFGDESIGFLREFNKRRNPIFFECRKN